MIGRGNNVSVGNRSAFAIFPKTSSRRMEIPEVTSAQALTTQIVSIEEIGNVVTREVERSPGFRTFHDLFRPGATRWFEGAGSARRTSIKRELSPSDGGIGPVNRTNRVVSLWPTAPPLTANRKVKDVVDEKGSGSDVELNLSGRIAHERLQTVLKPVRMVCDILLQRVRRLLNRSSRDVSEGEHASICKQPKNIRGIAKQCTLEYDQLGMRAMSHILELSSALLPVIEWPHILLPIAVQDLACPVGWGGTRSNEPRRIP